MPLDAEAPKQQSLQQRQREAARAVQAALEAATRSGVQILVTGATAIPIPLTLPTDPMQWSEAEALAHFGDADTCDCVLRAGRHRHWVHKARLSRASEFFDKLFNGPFRESREALVTLQGLPHADPPLALARVLEHLYTGQLYPRALKHDVIAQVASNAHYLGATLLYDTCVAHLAQHWAQVLAACGTSGASAMTPALREDVLQALNTASDRAKFKAAYKSALYANTGRALAFTTQKLTNELEWASPAGHLSVEEWIQWVCKSGLVTDEMLEDIELKVALERQEYARKTAAQRAQQLSQARASQQKAEAQRAARIQARAAKRRRSERAFALRQVLRIDQAWWAGYEGVTDAVVVHVDRRRRRVHLVCPGVFEGGERARFDALLPDFVAAFRGDAALHTRAGCAGWASVMEQVFELPFDSPIIQ
ncbi:hypothetical protein JKP88DRAFT_240785 [Tribonema minus]|uniref:BTB domain-containing protein n=1 Tax=Tribonema minus TaxID=303371 RepID=A0A835ZJ81_9STRA|nr:hypothetical protein JKP88DRAFT_240785 [Tribonema minus]